MEDVSWLKKRINTLADIIAEKEKQIKEKNAEIEDLLETISDFVDQNCLIENNPAKWDSMAISTNAYAMRLLAKKKKMKIISECGKRVIAIGLITAEKSRNPAFRQGGKG